MTSEGFVRHAEQTIESENTRDCTITVSQRSKLNQVKEEVVLQDLIMCNRQVHNCDGFIYLNNNNNNNLFT